MTEARVLACIDGAAASTAVVDYAAWVANKVGAGLTLLHCLPKASANAPHDYSGAIGLGSREELLEELIAVEQQRSRLQREKGQVMLEAAEARARADGVSDISLIQRHGSLAETLVELEYETRVLVLGLRGEDHEGDNSGIGHHLESVIRALHKPILVVNREFQTPKTVMLAYDGSPACELALELLSSRELFKDLSCHVTHVGGDAASLLPKAESRLRSSGFEPVTAALEGPIDKALSEYQVDQSIDLMLMGAFGHGRIRELLVGSFTHKMLSRTQRPLLLLR